MAKTKAAASKAAGKTAKADLGKKKRTKSPAKATRTKTPAKATSRTAAAPKSVARKATGSSERRGVTQASATSGRAMPRKQSATPTAKQSDARSNRARTSLAARGSVAKVKQESATPQQLAHGLNTLLHTMQAIQRFEETLCSLMHAMRHGRLSAPLERELKTTLHELPVAEYRDDVDALLHALR